MTRQCVRAAAETTSKTWHGTSQRPVANFQKSWRGSRGSGMCFRKGQMKKKCLGKASRDIQKMMWRVMVIFDLSTATDRTVICTQPRNQPPAVPASSPTNQAWRPKRIISIYNHESREECFVRTGSRISRMVKCLVKNDSALRPLKSFQCLSIPWHPSYRYRCDDTATMAAL